MTKKNINELTVQEKSKLMQSEFKKESRFEKLFNDEQVEIPCEEFYQKFRKQIERLLVSKGIVKEMNFSLEELHLHIPQEMRDYNFTDGVNKISTLFYENDEEFSRTYLDFIKNFVRKKFEFPFYFQAIPTVRIHCPNAKNSDHYPRYHTDIQYGHPVQEINLWFALTKTIGEQKHGFPVMNLKDSLDLYDGYGYDFSRLIDDTINSKEFNQNCENLAKQTDTKEGGILVFDSRLCHSGEPLKNHTRASIDVRIIAVEDYKKMPITYQGMGRRKILFTPGECYHALSSDQL